MLIWSISYPVCLPWRWKWEEINIGLSHHLLVHHSEVQLPAEDFDYFPPLWQTRSGLRSLSLLSFFFFFLSFFFTPSPAVCVFPASFWVLFPFFLKPTRDGLLRSLPLSQSILPSTNPTFTFPAGHDETDVNDPGVRGRRKLVATAHLCAGVCLRARIYFKFFMTLRGTFIHHFINYSIKCFSCGVKFWCVFCFDIWLHCQCISIVSYIGKDMWCKLIFETRYCYFLAVKIKNETAHSCTKETVVALWPCRKQEWYSNITWPNKVNLWNLWTDFTQGCQFIASCKDKTTIRTHTHSKDPFRVPSSHHMHGLRQEARVPVENVWCHADKGRTYTPGSSTHTLLSVRQQC